VSAQAKSNGANELIETLKALSQNKPFLCISWLSQVFITEFES
jgi:hypothetical protein